MQQESRVLRRNKAGWGRVKEIPTIYEGITKIYPNGKYVVNVEADYFKYFVGKFLTLKMAVRKRDDYVKKHRLNVPLLSDPVQ